MTSISDYFQGAVSFAGLSAYRTLIGTPLEGIAKRTVLFKSTPRQVIALTPFRDLWKGFQPNILKTVSKTYVQVGSVNVASHLIPTEIDPQYRGAFMGITSSSMEVSIQNIWNVLGTRFIQGERWSVVKKEGVSLFYQGLSPALLHRSLSGAIFWSAYEKLNQLSPHHSAVTGTCAGLIQVAFTSPLYITAVLRQGKDRPPESLGRLMVKIGRGQGWIRGLFLRALVPRSLLSIATSGPLMMLLEKYKVVHR
jgi:hypothetical protein